MDATRHQVPVTAGFASLTGLLLLAATIGTTLAQDRSSRRVIPGSATGTAQQTARQPATTRQPAGTTQSPNKRLPRSRLQAPDLRVQKLDPKLKAVLLKWEQATAGVKTLKGEIYRYHREFVFNTEKRARGVFYYESPDKIAFAPAPDLSSNPRSIEVFTDPLMAVIDQGFAGVSHMLFRCDAFREAGSCDPGLFAQDHSLFLRLALQGKIAKLNHLFSGNPSLSTRNLFQACDFKSLSVFYCLNELTCRDKAIWGSGI